MYNRDIMYFRRFLLVVFILGGLFSTSCGLWDEFTVDISADPVKDIRERTISIAVFDDEGNPLENAEIEYRQVSQDFMYNVGQYWDPYTDETGTNTAGIYLDWQWVDLEPEDDVYDWDRLKDTMMIDGEGNLVTDAEHVFIRMGVISTSAWIVGEGMDSFQETGYPGWIDKTDLAQVQEKYLEFVGALLGHLKFIPDFFMLEVEINALGINAGMTNEEIVDWMGRLTDRIKAASGNTPVAITIAAQDLSPFMQWGRDVNPEMVAEDRFQLSVTDFLTRMERVDYDIISVLVQPFGWFSQGDWEDGRNFFDSISGFGKDIYIAWIGFLAEEPEVPQELEPNPNNINGEAGFVYYPNPEGHSAEWQKDQTLSMMDYILSNPRVIGVYWDVLDYVEPGVGGRDFEVKLCTGFTTGYLGGSDGYVLGEKRPVYEPMRELWLSLFSEGNVMTGTDGRAVFTGLPGEYSITVSCPGYRTQKFVSEVR